MQPVEQVEKPKSLARGDLLTKETFDDFVARLKDAHHGAECHDHCTADPIYIVQEKKFIHGVDERFVDSEELCVHRDGDDTVWYSTEDYYNDLEDDDKENLDDPIKRGGIKAGFLGLDDEERWDILKNDDDLTVSGYKVDWEYVNSHFTRDAAEAFIARKKHDHKELRIYIDSQYWCWEFKAIVNALVNGSIVLSEQLATRQTQYKVGDEIELLHVSQGVWNKSTVYNQEQADHLNAINPTTKRPMCEGVARLVTDKKL